MVTTTKPNLTKVKKRKNKKKGDKALKKVVSDASTDVVQVTKKLEVDEATMDDLCERFPVLRNKDLIQSFLAVPMNNNQRGRIRQVLRDRLQGTSKKLLPDMINSKIQSILKTSDTLQENDLRKVRILFTMLKSATLEEKTEATKEKKPKEKKVKETDSEKKSEGDKDESKSEKKIKSENVEGKSDDKNKTDKKEGEKKESDKKLTTAKGVKRYVLFVGNLPLGIDKDTLTQHFQSLSDRIKDIRIPKVAEGKKSATAYLEVKDELGYEMALSRHHSMLGSKRINVLYSMQKNSNMSKEEAKSKSAKLIALQKSGKLLGSTPLNRKRSARRKKQKEARAREAKEE